MAAKKPASKTPAVKKSPAKKSAPVKKVAAKELAPTAAEKAQMKAISANASKPPKLSKEEAAAEKKRIAEGNKLMQIYSSVIVPTWFGQKDVSKTINKPLELRPESALCLVYIGARGAKGCSRVGVEFNLRPSGFDRDEASLFADMGCSSLIGQKFAKYVKKPKTEEDRRLADLVLTAKGQKYFDLIKRVGLQEPGKGSFMI